MATKQESVWRGTFGAEYTERCTFASVEEFNELYVSRYGVSREEIAAHWLADIPGQPGSLRSDVTLETNWRACAV